MQAVPPSVYGLTASFTAPYIATLTGTLTADRTYTFPDAAIIVAGSATALTSGLIPQAGTGGILADSALATSGITGALTLTKTGTTARTVTFPDAAITVAGLGLAQTWTADQTFDVIKTQHCDAATSAGVHIGNLTHQDVVIFGAGGSQGTTFYGQINGTTQSMSGQITSTVATGAAPFVVASTTKVANLNVDYLNGTTWAAPGAIGGTTPAAISCTTLTASGQVSGNTVIATTSYQVNNGGAAAIGQILQDGAYFGIVADAGNPQGLRLSAPGSLQSIIARVEGVDRLTITAASGAVFSTPVSCTTLTASSGITLTGSIVAATSDGSDTALVSICGGGSGAQSRGAFAYATGNEYSAAGYKGIFEFTAGFDGGFANADDGGIYFTTAGVRQLSIRRTGDATFASSVSCAGLTSTAAGVAATFDSGAASDARIEFKRNGVRQGLFSWDTSALRFEGDATASSAIYFKAGGADRLTIASGGTVTVTSTNDGSLTCAGRITAKVAVPGSFADLAAVQSYLVSILT